MQIDRHIDGRLQTEQDRQARRGETDERFLGAHRLEQRADHNEREQRDQNEAEHDAEFLAGDGKDEVGVAFGQDALDGAFARPAAEPAAADEGFGRDVDVEGVARAGSRKRLMRCATCGTVKNAVIRPTPAVAASPITQMKRMPAI